jgi:hypothetical protein
MKVLAWQVLATLFVLCGIAVYLVGWVALLTKSTNLVSADFWFADAGATAAFAIFFLILALLGQNQIGRRPE